MGKLGSSGIPSFIRSFVRMYSAPVDSSIPASKTKYVPTSGTYPKGFSVSGTHVGVKPSNTSKPDIALIASDRPCNGAAVFTTNKFQAAPVQVSRSVLEKRGGSGIRGIIVNSGCANAVTGTGGLEDAQQMASTTSSLFPPDDTSALGPSTLVMSTGVIGQRLPSKRFLTASLLPSLHSAPRTIPGSAPPVR